MKCILALLAVLILAQCASAQNVSVIGPITPGNIPIFNSTTVIKDSGVAGGGALFANPTATISSTPVNGSATTAMRSDAAPALAVNGVTNANLAQMLADTVKCNPTGVTANAQDCTALVLNPTASSLNATITTTQSVSGTTVANCTVASNEFPCVNLFYISSDNANAASPANALDGWQFSYTMGGSTLQGARQVLDTIGNFTSPSSASNTNRNYVGGTFEMNASSGDGGTGLTSATAKGSFFGINPVVRTTAAATNLLGVLGGEVDVVNSGTSFSRYGWSIVSFLGNIAQGTLPSTLPADAAINIGAASGAGATGWAHGIVFTNQNGFAPILTGGCLICTDGTANTVAKGVDLSAYTFSTVAYRSNNFSVDGSGNITANNLTPAWTVYTATATPTSGSITTQTSDSTFLQAGKWVRAHIAVTISNIGTGTTPITINAPAAAKHASTTCVGREGAVSGKMLAGILPAGSSTMSIVNYDNTTPTFSNGVNYAFDCSYEAN